MYTHVLEIFYPYISGFVGHMLTHVHVLLSAYVLLGQLYWHVRVELSAKSPPVQLKTQSLPWAKRAGTVGHVETQVLVEKSA